MWGSTPYHGFGLSWGFLTYVPLISLFSKSYFSCAGWLDCPSYGNEILGILVPSKVPLGESFNEDIIPGKRYSSKQVVHQQRVLSRKVSKFIAA